MKILLWDLLLLSLFSTASSSCQQDCMTCRESPALASFNLEVCILQCESKAFTNPFGTLCTKLMGQGPWMVSPANPEHAVTSPDQSRASEMQHLRRTPREWSLAQGQGPSSDGLEGPGQKQLQKRFGGFTGARKSARKLANQKRFSEFMRQYLVLSMQSSQRRRTLRQNGRL